VRASEPDYVIGLGANLGERLSTLRAAVARLDAEPGIRVLARSAVYESEPLPLPSVGSGAPRLARAAVVVEPQPRYLNAAVAVASDLTARALLDRLLSIEVELGRVRRERWGPRTLDLDVLWGRTSVDEPGLTVPHPQLLQRWFALAPLLEAAPSLGPRYALALAELGPCPPPHALL
jgi:2-amino-4-hydroxy-6-hydroxymethyldihydropteridine diphosphokinase